MSKFDLVKQYLFEMEIPIMHADPANELVIVTLEEKGLNNLVLDCEPPLLVVEQVIMKVPDNPKDLFKNLLKWNRNLVHGSFCLDDNGELIIFRDALELENLDRNELEATIRALELAMAEHAGAFLQYAK